MTQQEELKCVMVLFFVVTHDDYERMSLGIILPKVNNAVTPLYAFTDNLGSVTRLYTETGVEKFRAQYDPWGVQVVNRNDINFARGYCGHEMLNDFQLINMNGRMYDPVLGRFLSPDNYVQMPTSAQGFNRYSYCLNNPLKYIDPDGEFVFSLFLGPVGAVIDAACWGAVIGGASYTVSVAISHGGFNNWNWGQFGKSLGFGAISGAVSFGIGEGFQALGNIAGNIGTPIIQGITHGIASGSISVLEGGNFLQGLVSGTFSSWAGSGYDAIGFGGQLGTTSMLGFGALSGGIGSWVSGGNFLHGVAIGALTSGLNHLQHKTEEYKFFHRLRRHYNKGTGEDFNIKPDEFKYLIKKGDIDFTNAKDIGDGYYSATINFYNSSNDLALSFGRATVIYKKYNGRNVYKHFYDRYDFDAKHWGVRSFLNEIITRSYGKLYGGKAFDIYYNKLWRK